MTDWILRIFAAFALIAGANVVGAAGAVYLRDALAGARVDPQLRVDLSRWVHPLSLGVGAVMAAGVLGIDGTGLAAVLGAAVIAGAIGAQPALAQLSAGWWLANERPFAEGDTVELDADRRGVVTRIGRWSVTLRREDGATIVVPNRLILDRAAIVHAKPPPGGAA